MQKFYRIAVQNSVRRSELKYYTTWANNLAHAATITQDKFKEVTGEVWLMVAWSEFDKMTERFDDLEID